MCGWRVLLHIQKNVKNLESPKRLSLNLKQKMDSNLFFTLIHYSEVQFQSLFDVGMQEMCQNI